MLLRVRVCDAWVVPTGCVHSHWFQRGKLCSTPRHQRDAYSVLQHNQALRTESSASQTRTTPIRRFWYPSARSKALRDTKPWFT